MSPLGVKDVHVNQAMTNVAIGYHPHGLIAEQIFPIIPVSKESDYYYVWNRDEAFRIENTLRADGAEANEVEFNVDKELYGAEEYALKTGVTDRQMENSDSVLNLKISKQKRLQDKLLIDLEMRIATLLTTEANYATTNYLALTGTMRFNDSGYVAAETADPTYSVESRIDVGKEAIRKQCGGLEPNVIIIPSAVAKVVKKNKTVRDLIKYTHADLLVDGDLPPQLWGMKVLIPKGTYATAVEGASSQTMGDIWGNNIIMLYVNPSPAIDAVSCGYIFRSKGWTTREWREEWKKRDVVETGYIQAEKLVSNVAGYLLETVIN